MSEKRDETEDKKLKQSLQKTNSDDLELQCGDEQGEEDDNENLVIKLNAHFSSFIELRSTIENYQKEKHVQLIVKDSKLLSSAKRIIPKVYHLVNQDLMYHSITYCCKCHGELKQKSGSRIRNAGAKRLGCPMYIRFKLSADLQSLVLFDLLETHTHSTDPNTFTLSPRQQIYRISAIRSGQPDPGATKPTPVRARQSEVDVKALIATAVKDVNSVSSLSETDYEPPSKAARIPGNGDNIEPTNTGKAKTREERVDTGVESGADENQDSEEEDEDGHVLYKDNPNTPLDPESSCSDSDEEEFRKIRELLPLPLRLMGSALQCSPRLLALSKEWIESEKEKILSEKKRIIMETQMLELKNAKLALELKILEKNRNASNSNSDQASTFYVQS